MEEEMSKPFDAATKRLVEADPLAWLRYAGLPGDAAELMDADLSAITSEADRILHVRAPEYLAHIELQASYQTDMGERVLVYSVLAYAKYKLPVQSVVVLLRKEADGPAMSGQAGYAVPDSPDGWVAMRYRVVRVWEKSAQELLAGPLATLPLAPLTNVSRAQLPAVIRRMEERIRAEASAEDAGGLWTSVFLLLGLKYRRDVVRDLLKGVRGMRESDTYLAILEEGEARGEAKGRAEGKAEGKAEGRAEGKAEEARNLVLRLGVKRFGPLASPAREAIERIVSLEELERLAERILEVESWKELLE
jgi:predicted transposase YdaD